MRSKFGGGEDVETAGGTSFIGCGFRIVACLIKDNMCELKDEMMVWSQRVIAV